MDEDGLTARSFKIITDLGAPVLCCPLQCYHCRCLRESNEQEVSQNDAFTYLVPLWENGQGHDPHGQNHNLQ
jgi:hypothetical protein